MKDWKYCLLGLGICTTLCLIVFWKFLSFQNIFAFIGTGSDTVHSYWPYIEYLNQLLREGLPFWSFKIGLGANLFTLKPFLLDPFNVLAFIVDRSVVPFVLGYIFVLKILFSYFAFFLYLRTFQLKGMTKIVMSLLYAFSGFMLLWGQHYFFSTAVALFPLILIGLEAFLLKRNYYLFPLVIFLFFIFDVYFLFMISVFLPFYFLGRFFYCNDGTKGVCVETFKIIGLYFLGLGLGAFFALPYIHLLWDSPRTGGSLDLFLPTHGILIYVAMFLRVFSNELMGLGPEYIGPKNYYSAPMLYSGIISLFLCVNLFFTKNKLLRKYVIIGALLICLTLFFPFFSIVFSGFSASNFRWSFLVVFMVVFFAGLGLNDILEEKKSNTPFLGLITGLIMIVPLVFIFYGNVSFLGESVETLQGKMQQSASAKTAFNSVCFFIFVYSILFQLLYRNAYFKFVLPLMALAFVAEIYCFASTSINERATLTSQQINAKWGYFDETKDLVAQVKQADEDVFFRVAKSYRSVFANDSLMQDYWGTKTYLSLLPSSVLRLTEYFEIPMPFGRVVFLGAVDDLLLDSVFGVRYYLIRNQHSASNVLLSTGIEGRSTKVYKNAFSLPLFSLYDSWISEDYLKQLPVDQRSTAILRHVSLAGSVETIVEVTGVIETFRDGEMYDEQKLLKNFKEKSQLKFDILDFKEDSIRANLELPRQGFVFFPIPYSEGWEVKVDGDSREIKRANVGFMGFELEEGIHSVELKFTPPLLKVGGLISLVSLFFYGFLLYYTQRRNKK